MSIFHLTQSVFVEDEPCAVSAPPKAVSVLDLRTETCPMTLVKARLTLDRAAPSAVLQILIRGDEPVQNLPRALARLGFLVTAPTPCSEGAPGDHCFQARKP